MTASRSRKTRAPSAIHAGTCHDGTRGRGAGGLRRVRRSPLLGVRGRRLVDGRAPEVERDRPVMDGGPSASDRGGTSSNCE
jgi:hypothetical protein